MIGVKQVTDSHFLPAMKLAAQNHKILHFVFHLIRATKKDIARFFRD
jgi:hypothetical protein